MRLLTNGRKRFVYAFIFLVLAVSEVLIALYVRDAFVRPYFGDVLIAVLLCALVRIFLPNGLTLLPLFVFFFSTMVETLQYFHFVDRVGLGNSAFFRTLIGTSFSFWDILCYFVGCVSFFGVECVMRRKSKRASATSVITPPKE